MEKLWTTSEVARFLGIQEEDVEQLVREGRLNGYRLGGQFLRFRPDHIQQLKLTLQVSPIRVAALTQTRTSWIHHLRDVCYFYDFYIVSVLLLISVILYLLVSG